jgi:hypothetical protein
VPASAVATAAKVPVFIGRSRGGAANGAHAAHFVRRNPAGVQLLLAHFLAL